MKSVSLAEFAQYFRIDPSAVPERIAAELAQINTRHREPNKEELEDYIDYFIKKVSKSSARRSTEENLEIFERGWAENLESSTQKFDAEAIRPKYFQNMRPYYPGLDGRMYFCDNRELPVDMLTLYVKHLFLKFFGDFESIHEFGSGSGQNLLTMSALAAPSQKFTGYDWTESGAKLADMIGEKTGRNVTGYRFDMLKPDYSVEITGQAVLTVMSIEQLADQTEAFLEFLLAKKPALVIHLEPDASLKGGNSMYSHLSDLYANLRGYTQNYHHALKRQEEAGRLTIKQAFNLPWLTNFYNIVCHIWSPL